MPVRVKTWKFRLMVGRSKQCGHKVHWETEDGEPTGLDQCIWQPKSSIPGDPTQVTLSMQDLQGKTLTLQVSGNRTMPQSQMSTCRLGQVTTSSSRRKAILVAGRRLVLGLTWSCRGMRSATGGG